MPHPRLDVPARDRLRYIATMLGDLKEQCPPEIGPLLPHLIDMAQLEAMEHALTMAADTDTGEVVEEPKVLARFGEVGKEFQEE